MNAPANFMSMYIPRIAMNFTAERLAEIISYYKIGTVHSVDFIPLNKKNGFHEKFEGDYKAAFVHVIKSSISQEMMDAFWQKLEENKINEIWLNKFEYLMCLKAIRPIERTGMNIHQVVENGKYLEDLITTQNKELKQMKEHIQHQDIQIEGLKNVVYQLVGGLFCQSTQSKIMSTHLSELGFDLSPTSKNDSHRFKSFPTTRQGDEHEKRIEVLEGIIHKMCKLSEKTDKFNRGHVGEMDMDALAFSMQSSSSSSSDEETLSTYSDNSERIKNSYDLCGNA